MSSQFISRICDRYFITGHIVHAPSEILESLIALDTKSRLVFKVSIAVGIDQMLDYTCLNELWYSIHALVRIEDS